MSKIKIKVKLKTDNNIINSDTKGLINDNIIIYKDGKFNIKLDLNNLLLERYSDDYKIIIDFKNKNYILMINNYNLTDKIKIFELVNEKNYFKANYELDNNIEYEIFYEVIK